VLDTRATRYGSGSTPRHPGGRHEAARTRKLEERPRIPARRVGSAVGLGNLWRFADLTSEGDRAAFVLAYLVLVAVVGMGAIMTYASYLRGAGTLPREASAIAIADVPVALDTAWVGVLDQIVGNPLLIFGGLMTAVLVGYVWRGADQELARGFPYAAARRAWR